MVAISSLDTNLLFVWEYRALAFSSTLSVVSVQQLKAQLQANILLILFGVLLIALGFSAIALFMLRWKTKELSLADEFVDAFLEHLSNWSGKRSGEAADDDLTLMVIELEKIEEN